MKVKKVKLSGETRIAKNNEERYSVKELMMLYLDGRIEYRSTSDLRKGLDLFKKLEKSNASILLQDEEYNDLKRLIESVPQTGLFAIGVIQALDNVEEVDVKEGGKNNA